MGWDNYCRGNILLLGFRHLHGNASCATIEAARLLQAV